mmetsp:Transcript_30950/g.42892  ORF Transcript_30950/g.42892 Transcript_30950/m.42892 type:complete len:133 (+) Transcript_30950:3-401(+)
MTSVQEGSEVITALEFASEYGIIKKQALHNGLQTGWVTIVPSGMLVTTNDERPVSIGDGDISRGDKSDDTEMMMMVYIVSGAAFVCICCTGGVGGFLFYKLCCKKKRKNLQGDNHPSEWVENPTAIQENPET